MTEQNKNNSIHNSMAVGETRQDKTRQDKTRRGRGGCGGLLSLN